MRFALGHVRSVCVHSQRRILSGPAPQPLVPTCTPRKPRRVSSQHIVQPQSLHHCRLLLLSVVAIGHNSSLSTSISSTWSSPRSMSPGFIIVRPAPPGMPFMLESRSSSASSFVSFGLNCSSFRTLPLGHAGTLPFLHTPAILVHTRCATEPTEVFPLCASSSTSAHSSISKRSTMPSHAFAKVRHSRRQTPGPLCVSTRARSFFEMSSSDNHSPSLPRPSLPSASASQTFSTMSSTALFVDRAAA
mmetsp:Transcript_10604/g.24577  ORF Transcript_10604/g.24577 Transcript_10604/m.24577 type:complete len:246 (+) Transcript_10604:162-899(+)